MADKQISDLTSASSLTDGSLFVLEQGGAAKKANWGMMKNYLSPGIAPQYSTSSTYAVGDYVIHNDQLYRCTTAITTAEAWTAAHWTAAVLGDDVGDLKSAIEEVTEKSKNLLPTQSKTITVNDVTVVYGDGTLELSGTATGTGGRLTPVTDSFVLPAGTYTFYRAPQAIPFFLESGDSIIAQINNDSTSKTFTIANETTCYIGVNVDSGTTYDYTFNVQLETGDNASGFEPPSYMTAKDDIARGGVTALETATADIITEFPTVKSDVNTLKQKIVVSKDLTGETATTNELINSNNGTVITDQPAVYAATDFIDISDFAGTNCSVRSLFGGWFGLAFYNSSETFISGYGSSQTGTTADAVATVNVDIPANAKYIRFSLRTNVSSNVTDYPIIYNGSIDALVNDRIRQNNIDLFENGSSTLSVFEKIGVCGDSFASGEIHVGNNTQMYYNLSWPQILARECGVSVYNYSVSGYSTRTFLTSGSRGLPKLLSDEPQDLYIMAFGLNDINISNYIGSIDDITADYHNNPDTFYGNYARIIEQVKAHAPNAKIILSTMARKFSQSAYTAFDDAIVEIAEYYNIPYLCVMDDPFFNSSFYQSGLVGYHPTGVLYAGMAKAYQRLFSKSTIDYAAYYADYVGD